MTKPLLDPYSDVADSVAEVIPAMKAAISRTGTYFAKVNMGTCKGCGQKKDLRFGYCCCCCGICQCSQN